MIVLKPGTGASGVKLFELAFSPDGTMLTAPAMDAGIMFWNTFTSGAKAKVVKVPVTSVLRLAFAPEGTTLYAGDDEICALNVASRTAERLPIAPWHSLWFGVSPDGSRLIVSEQNRAASGCRVTGWEVGRHREPVWKTNMKGQVWSPPLFIANDRFLFCEHRRGAGRRWFAHRVTRSAATGEELDVSAPFADLTTLTVLSADGRLLACRTREVVRIYPAAGAWKDVPVIVNDSRKHFTGVAFHPSGKYLAATSNDKTVKLYDTTNWQLVRTLTWAIGNLWSVAFSPDGTLAAAGIDTGKVVLWDVDL